MRAKNVERIKRVGVAIFAMFAGFNMAASKNFQKATQEQLDNLNRIIELKEARIKELDPNAFVRFSQPKERMLVAHGIKRVLASWKAGDIHSQSSIGLDTVISKIGLASLGANLTADEIETLKEHANALRPDLVAIGKSRENISKHWFEFYELAAWKETGGNASELDMASAHLKSEIALLSARIPVHSPLASISLAVMPEDWFVQASLVKLENALQSYKRVASSKERKIGKSPYSQKTRAVIRWVEKYREFLPHHVSQSHRFHEKIKSFENSLDSTLGISTVNRTL